MDTAKAMFIVKSGSGQQSTPEGMLQTSRIEYLMTMDFDMVRDFIFMGEPQYEIDRLNDKLQSMLLGETDAFQLVGSNKFVVRCGIATNEMLQIYEIVKTLKEA